MARSYGRLFSSVWDDAEFCSLSANARGTYFYLLSQRDLEHSGIIGVRLGRWADNCGDTTEDSVREGLEELAKARFVVVDWRKEELLVRSLIRRDEVWKQPNVFKAAAASIRAVRSVAIREALLSELGRLDLREARPDVVALRDTLVSELRASLSPTPPEPFPNPAGNPSPTLPEGSEADRAEATGTGEGNGGNQRSAFPLSPKPSPAPFAMPARALGASLLQEHLDQVKPRPPRDMIRQLGERIERLLDDEDVSADEIRRALARLRENPKWGAGMLTNLVHEIRQHDAHPGAAAQSRASPRAHQPYRNPADESAYEGEIRAR